MIVRTWEKRCLLIVKLPNEPDARTLPQLQNTSLYRTRRLSAAFSQGPACPWFPAGAKTELWPPRLIDFNSRTECENSKFSTNVNMTFQRI